MSLFKGGLTLTRYRVVGGKKHYKFADLDEHLSHNGARPVRLKGVQRPLLAGWVRPLGDEPISEDEGWSMSDARVEDGYLLRLRVEKRKVPASLVSLVVRKRQEKRERTKERSLSRTERKDLIETVRTELMDQCLPTISYMDAYWDEGRREVIVFQTGRTMLALFEQLFHKTFGEPLGIHLMRVTPPLAALTDEDWTGSQSSERVERIGKTVPVSFSL